MSTDFILSPEFFAGPDSGIEEQQFLQVDTPEGGLFKSVFSQLLARFRGQVKEDMASYPPGDSLRNPLAGFLLAAPVGEESTKGNIDNENEKTLFNQGELTGRASLLEFSFLEGETGGGGVEEPKGEKSADPSDKGGLVKETNISKGVYLEDDPLQEIGLNASQGSMTEGAADSAPSDKGGLKSDLTGQVVSSKEGLKGDLAGQMVSSKEGLKSDLAGEVVSSKQGLKGDPAGQGNEEKTILPEDRFENMDNGQRIAARSSAMEARSNTSRGVSLEQKAPSEMGLIASRESGSKGAESGPSDKESLGKDLAFKGLLNEEGITADEELNPVRASSLRQISKVSELIERDRNVEEKIPTTLDAPRKEKGSMKEIQKNDFRVESLFLRDFSKTQVSNDNGSEISPTKAKDHSVLEEKVLDQVKGGIRIILKRGGNGIRIRLHPPSLGQIRMEVTVNSDMVRTFMVAESNLVKGIIEGNINQLKQAFQEQGLRMEQFNVHVNNGQGQGGTASSNWSFRQGSDVLPSETLLNPKGGEGFEDETPIYGSDILTDQRINIFV